MTPHELAMEKARQQRADRTAEAWTWQEIAELLDLPSCLECYEDAP